MADEPVDPKGPEDVALPNNVTSIEGRKLEKAQKQKTINDFRAYVKSIFLDIIRGKIALNKRSSGGLLSWSGLKLPNYKIYSPDGRNKLLVKIDPNGVASYESDVFFHSSVCKFITAAKEEIMSFTDFSMDEHKGLLNNFIIQSDPIEISPMENIDSPKISFFKTKFPIPDNMNPVWRKIYESLKLGDESFLKEYFEKYKLNFLDFVLRMKENRLAFLSFTWSIFEPKSDKTQYLYLHGRGRDGKSSYLKMLQFALDDYYTTAYPPNEKGLDKFWTSQFENKRIVAFADCNAPWLASSGLFKSVTGGDKVAIDIKYGKKYSINLFCKFIFCSNETISMRKTSIADRRRLIYVDMDTLKKEPIPEATWDEILKIETPQFLAFCKYVYTQETKDGKLIEATYGAIDDNVSEDDEFDLIARDNFEFPDKGNLINWKKDKSKKEAMRNEWKVSSGSIFDRLYGKKMDNRKMNRFFSWLENTYGVEKYQEKNTGTRFKIWMKIKPIIDFTEVNNKE